MDYEIIFYHSGKTAEIERMLERRLEGLGLKRSISAAAADPSELAGMLGKSLSRCELIFVVGGLDNSTGSTDNVLSSVLSSEKGKLSSERLIDDNENTAYLIRSEKQLIAVVPDETEVIEKMLDKKIISEIKTVYSLSEKNDEKPSIKEIKDELDKQLNDMGRTRTNVQPQTDIENKTDVLLYLSVSLGIVSVLLLIAALILFLI